MEPIIYKKVDLEQFAQQNVRSGLRQFALRTEILPIVIESLAQ